MRYAHNRRQARSERGCRGAGVGARHGASLSGIREGSTQGALVVLSCDFRGNSAPDYERKTMWLTLVVGELERERAMRVYVFPRLIRDGKLTSSEAQMRAERFDAAIDLLKQLIEAGVATTDDLALRLTPPSLPSDRRRVCNQPIRIKGAE